MTAINHAVERALGKLILDRESGAFAAFEQYLNRKRTTVTGCA